MHTTQAGRHVLPNATADSPPSVAFYAVADAKFFPGLAAMLNSLRLVGHTEPIFVVDAGLTAAQRKALVPHATVLPATAGDAAVFLAPAGPLRRPAEVMVLIDADIIVTRPLTKLIEEARTGHVVGIVNEPPNHDRWFPEWSEVLGLGPVRRQPYLCAGLIVLSQASAGRLLQPWLEGQAAIGLTGTRYGSARLNDPFYFADQDVLNALLGSTFEASEIIPVDYRLGPFPPFRGLTIVDPKTLACRYDDLQQPYLLHHVMNKPWLRRTPTNAYSRLMSRLLLEPDVAVSVPAHELPLRLRSGATATLARWESTAVAVTRMQLRRQLGRFGIRTRLREWRARESTIG
jgi:hypothetical protein